MNKNIKDAIPGDIFYIPLASGKILLKIANSWAYLGNGYSDSKIDFSIEYNKNAEYLGNISEILTEYRDEHLT